MCGLTLDGVVYCGNREQGDEGVVLPAGEYTQITAGDDHMCGLRVDRSVACWPTGAYSSFRNAYGEQFEPEGEFIEVSASGRNTCGLRTDRTATCWGDNDIVAAHPPVGEFLTISAAAGRARPCGIRPDNTIECWGYQDLGEPQASVGELSDAAVGAYYACGIRADESESIVCWHRETGESVEGPDGSYRHLSLADDRLCAVSVDGRAGCWTVPDMNPTGPPKTE